MGLKRKLLGAVGFDAEPAPTAEDEREREYNEQMVMAWRWLRSHALDRTISEYFATGRFDHLNEYVIGAAGEHLRAHLSAMREQGIAWKPSSPKQRQDSEVTIVASQYNNEGGVQSFIVQESFLDYSTIAYVNEQGQVVGTNEANLTNPERRVLHARVICDGPQNYRLSELKQVAIGV